MEKKLFIALGLHLYTFNQLELILNIIGDIELILLFLILKRKNYFVQFSDYIFSLIATFTIVHTMFKVECLTFFSVIFWFQWFILIMYLIQKGFIILRDVKKK